MHCKPSLFTTQRDKHDSCVIYWNGQQRAVLCAIAACVYLHSTTLNRHVCIGCMYLSLGRSYEAVTCTVAISVQRAFK